MDSNNPQIEELQALQESLELQRRHLLAEILELQGGGAGSEETKKLRLKLVLINQELGLCKVQIKNLRRPSMAVKAFETPDTIQTIIRALQKGVNADLKEAVRVRDEVEVKLQVLTERKAKFEGQKGELAAEIKTLRQEISRVLGEGGDPSEINRQIRVKAQEIEALDNWIEQLTKSVIPEAEKLLSEAKLTVWNFLIQLAREAKKSFSQQRDGHLDKAVELSDSWRVALRQFHEEFRTGRYPTDTCLTL